MISKNEPVQLVKLSDVVGGGYKDFWNFKGRYRVCKGSRASKKSKTTALNFIVRMMQYPGSNLLVVRKVYSTLANSCYTELKWAIHRLGVDAYWEFKKQPLEMTYLPTGQKIYFRGMDDGLKITSITVEVGYLCWCWIEEAYELTNEDQFNLLDESIRGALPPESGLFKQITLIFNPWNEHHWLKARFFDVKEDPDILAITTNYTCNEWLDESDKRLFERMKAENPKRYRVAGLGEWGIVDGTVYENWEEKAFDVDAVRKLPSVKSAFGLDFGYVNDPSALFCSLVDKEAHTIWVFDEMYEYGYSNEDIAEKVKAMGYQKEHIIADSAEPKSIDRLYDLGLRRIERAKKGRDSVRYGIDNIRDYHIIIHPKCVNFITEISNYTWKEDPRTGKKLNEPSGDFNHLMDAMRYALEQYITGDKWIY